MIKKLCLFICMCFQLYASNLEELTWPSGATFLTFLESNSIPVSLYYELDREDKELASEIMAGVKYQILRDDDEQIHQVLIPVNEELQIQIYRDEHGAFKLELVPISYEVEDRVLSIRINNSPHQDIAEQTGNTALANAFSVAMRGQLDFRKLKKNDRVIVVYTQKRRLGRVFGRPEIHAAMVEMNKKQYTVYKFEDKFYDKSGKQNDKFFLTRPIANARITSPFTLKRFHPVLRRYKAHLGVDYGAPKGTPIKSAGDGTVKFVGNKSGYGKVLIIGHGSGYETLYAHLNGFAKGMRSGLKVKQGQLVAYVGNTGMSTGPHLHFGLYKSQQAINPESMLKVKKSGFEDEDKVKFQKIMSENNSKMKPYIENDIISEKEEPFENFIEL